MQASRTFQGAATGRLFAGLFILAPFATAALVACGGGGTGATSAGAGTQSVVEGTIMGLGSVFVNGIEYDTSTAAVTDELGNAQSQDALKLGMHVELVGSDPSTSGGEGRAGTVVFTSDLEGAVTAIDGANGSFTVLAQDVDTNANTVWALGTQGGMNALTVGAVVKVYSLYDGATGHYVASRVEADPTATTYKIRGTVSNLDTTTKTYSVGNLPIDYSGVTSPPAALADGVIATAELQTTEGPTAWMATGVQLRNHGLPGNKVNIHVRGLIATEASPTQFTLDGWPVEATGANFPSGQSVIVAGASVQVDGIMDNGVLVATNVDLQQAGSHGGLDFQVHGPIQSIDTTAQTFVLRGTTVSYAGSVTYTGGDASSLGLGTKVLVQGTLSGDGSTVQAATIAIGQ